MDSVHHFKVFENILRTYEIATYSKFNVYQNKKGFMDENRHLHADMRLHWKDGLPYFHLGSRMYTCHQGRDKNLSKKMKYREEKLERAMSDDTYYDPSYNLTESKKLDCPASFTVTRVYTLPNLKLEDPTKTKKAAVSVKIKSKLARNGTIDGEEAFWFKLPSVNDHENHIQGVDSASMEPVDPVVRSKIKELVRDGQRNVTVISALLEVFVRNELMQNDRSRRRFFPDIRTIKDIMKQVKNVTGAACSKREAKPSKKSSKTSSKTNLHLQRQGVPPIVHQLRHDQVYYFDSL